MTRKKKNKGNPDPKLPPTRGVPADQTLWFPKHYGAEIRKKGGLDPEINWEVQEIVDFIFPKKYQPTYHDVARDLLKLLLKKEYLEKNDISKFLEENGYSRATLQNKIIPKLVRFGVIKREREVSSKSKKGKGMILQEAMTFSNYLEKLAKEWRSVVKTARHKRRASKEEE